MTRRSLSLSDKVEVLLRQAKCAHCGIGLAWPVTIEWDHIHALARGGADDARNIQALCTPCHARKTNGLPATTRGSDKAEIAKTKRLTADEEAFRRALLAKPTAYLAADHHDAAMKPRAKIPSRPFPTRRKPDADRG